MRAGMGAQRQQAVHDPRQTTARARATFLARFERDMDPTGALAPEGRARRAEQARRAYFTVPHFTLVAALLNAGVVGRSP
jgi:hypothetical protein